MHIFIHICFGPLSNARDLLLGRLLVIFYSVLQTFYQSCSSIPETPSTERYIIILAKVSPPFLQQRQPATPSRISHCIRCSPVFIIWCWISQAFLFLVLYVLFLFRTYWLCWYQTLSFKTRHIFICVVIHSCHSIAYFVRSGFPSVNPYSNNKYCIEMIFSCFGTNTSDQKISHGYM